MDKSTMDILCVGDVVIDAFLTLHNANVHCHLNHDQRALCIEYGSKIPLDDCQFLTGGDGANVSVGLSRLGYKAGLMAEIGDDEFSQKIVNSLKKEQVITSHVIQTQGGSSTFSVIINFQGERTIFTKHITRSHPFSFENIQASWVYLTSLGKEWGHVYQKTAEFVKESGSHLALNPGAHQLDEGLEIVRALLSQVDLLFVNKEEAERILNIVGRNEEIKKLLKGVQQLGAKSVVITDGKNGSYAIDYHGEIVFCNTYDSPRVEATGAGDAYASGILGATLSGKTLSEAMKWGTVNATSVIGKVGAQPGLLTREEIEKKILEHPELKTEKII